MRYVGHTHTPLITHTHTHAHTHTLLCEIYKYGIHLSPKVVFDICID